MGTEISLEERNAIYEATGGAFGPDPDAYGMAVMQAEGLFDECECGHEFRRHDSEDQRCDCCPCRMFKEGH